MAVEPRTGPCWDGPDDKGLLTARLDDPLRVSLKGRRLRQAAAVGAIDAAVWPADWRQLAAAWVARADPERPLRFERLLQLAGERHANAVHPLLEDLLERGALRVEERRDARGWHLLRVWFRDPSGLRGMLGLAEPDAAARAWQRAREQVLPYADLDAARCTLDLQPPKQALARLALLEALARWRSERTRGFSTRRDFAWFARGDTKAIGDAEWRWLDSVVDLERDGISAHAPLLLIGGELALESRRGRIDCNAIGGFVAVPAQAWRELAEVAKAPRRWLVVENLGAFEHRVRGRETGDAVLWLPGYPPRWWKEAVDRLLALAPAPALIACDPDPDGIRIALAAGNLWQQRGLDWAPDRMSAPALAGLTHRRPLSERDSGLLDELLALPLPDELRALAGWMRENREKGEQEALFGDL